MPMRIHLAMSLVVIALAACDDVDAQRDLGVDLSMGPSDLAVPPIRFIALGDTGKGTAGQYEVANAMKGKCAASGCDFVLLLGDNIYETGATSVSDPQFQDRFELPYADLDMPFYVALGNHDYGNAGVGNEFEKPDNEIAYSNVSSKWRLPARTYHLKVGAAELFALDTNATLWSVDADNAALLDQWIADSTAPWKIAFGHHPYRSNGPHGNAGTYDGLPADMQIFSGGTVKAFMEAHVCGKVDLYLSGHDHSRQWLEDTCDGTELVVDGAGAQPTPLPGLNPARFQKDTLGFLYVVLEARSLTAEFMDTSGNVEFTRTLTR